MNTMNTNHDDTTLLFADSDRGVYIPYYFARNINVNAFSDTSTIPKAEALEILKELAGGPGIEHYWELWDDVTDKTQWVINGITYSLHHEGDLWLVPSPV